ncbi:ABC transporter permease [Nocardioides sp. LHD-245]|uniref:ABC transporter permease n=1 Tax=Nocardioides sp. LHD-245 TaxID=3051387 RepID=UPI0027E15C5C|nr:ABC transporter permease [Nocardioides sp. LHD-245]
MWAVLLRTCVQRAGSIVLTLVLATVITFGLQKLVPGDPALAIAGEDATAQRVAEIRADLGLDRPFVVQYLDWLRGAVTGDLGTTIRGDASVWDLIGQRLPATLTLAAVALLFSIIIGVGAGVAAALRHGSKADTAVTAVATLGVAVPNFWLGMVIVVVFGLTLNWLPVSGYALPWEDFAAWARHVTLPAIALGTAGAAEIARQVRSALVEVLRSDFIRTHRAKGLPQRAVVWRHAMKNASLPLVTVVGLQISHLLGGTVVIESVFAIPGIGSLIVQSANQRDYPVIQGVVFVTALLIILTNLAVDLVYRYVDPRIGVRPARRAGLRRAQRGVTV